MQNFTYLSAVSDLALGHFVIDVGEAEGQAYRVKAKQLQPIHDRGKVHSQAVRACAVAWQV